MSAKLDTVEAGTARLGAADTDSAVVLRVWRWLQLCALYVGHSYQQCSASLLRDGHCWWRLDSGIVLLIKCSSVDACVQVWRYGFANYELFTQGQLQSLCDTQVKLVCCVMHVPLCGECLFR